MPRHSSRAVSPGGSHETSGASTTAGLVGLLYRLEVEHPWRDKAEAWQTKTNAATDAAPVVGLDAAAAAAVTWEPVRVLALLVAIRRRIPLDMRRRTPRNHE